MAGLKFTFEADIQKLVQTRKEMEKLRAEIIKMPSDSPQMQTLQNRLKKLKEEYTILETILSKIHLMAQEAAKADDLIKQTQQQTKETDKATDSFKAEADSLLELEKQSKKLTKEWLSMSEAQRQSSTGQGKANEIASINAQRKIELDGLRSLQKEYMNTKKVQDLQEGSIKALRAQLSNLNALYDSLGRSQRNGAYGKELLTSIQAVTKELSAAEQASMRFQRNVGNYASGWNGLNVQMQQVARELPSLAIGANTFFLAISNNLPMLADEIKKARTEYKNLIAEGKNATPVWRQLISSIISWQTALVAGITVLSMYGKEIMSWIGSLFKAKKVLSETYQTLEEYQKKVGDTSGSVISTLERLSTGWKRLGNDVSAQKKFIIENKDAISSMGVAVNDAAEAERLFNTNKDAFIMSLLQRAKAAATMELAAEEYKKAVQKMMEADTMSDTTSQFIQTSSFGTGYWREAENIKKKRVKEEAEALFKSGSELVAKYAQFSENERKTLESIGIKATETMIDGSVEAIEAIISVKQQALKKVSDPTEYKRIEAEIRAEQMKLEAITGKSAKSDNSIMDQQNRIQDLLYKNVLDRIKTEVDLENQVDEARIKAMKDGFEKTEAQREFDNKKELQGIQRQKEEYIRSYTQAQKEIFDAQEELKARQNPGYKKQSFDSSSVSVNTSKFDDLTSLTKKRQSSDLAEYYKDLLSKYQDYASKRIEVQSKFNKDREALEKAGASKEQTGELEYQRKKALDAVDEEFAIREDSFQSWMDSIADLSLNKLREQLMLAKEELQRQEFSNPNDPRLATQRAKVTGLENTISKKSQSTSSNKRTIKEWQDLYSTLQKVDRQFSEIGDTVGGTAGEIIKTAGSINSATLQMIDGIVTLADESTWAIMGTATAAQTAIKMVENASVILAVISAALKIATAIASLFKRTDYMAEFRKEMAKLNYELEITKLNARIGANKHDSIFGDDLWRNAIDNIDAARDALQGYNDTLDKIAGRSVYEGISKKVANIFGIDFSETYSSFQESVADMAIQIRHSTWFRSAKYQSLKDAVPELFNKDGSVDMDALEKFMGTDTFKKLSESNQRYLQEMSDYWKAYQDAVDEVKSYLTDIFGDLGNTMTDALVDAFENGSDAAKAFTDSVSEMLENLAKQMIYSLTLGDLFEKAQTEALNIMQKKRGKGEEDKMFEEMADLMNRVTDDAIKQQEEANKLLSQWQQIAADKGFNIFTPGGSPYEQSATSGGFEAMSEDSANELNGRFTALQMAGEEIKDQNIIQTNLLSLINEKMTLITGGTTPAKDLPDTAGEVRSIISNSYQSSVNIVYPDTKLDDLTKEVSNLGRIVDEMRTFQVEGNMDRRDLVDNTVILAKNSLKVLANTDEIKRHAQRL